MVIDLPANTVNSSRSAQSPLNQLVSQRQDALQAALRALNIKAGETVNALVRNVTQVDDATRARLIQLANPVTDGSDIGAGKNATAPANLPPGQAPGQTPAPVASLTGLLNAAGLKLVEVDIRGQSLLVFSDQPVKSGQKLTVEVLQQGLRLLPAPTTSPAYTTQLRSAEVAGNRTAQPGVSPSSSSLTRGQQATLQEALRSLLPQFSGPGAERQSTLATTLLATELLAGLLQKPALAAVRQQLPGSLQESLQRLAAQLRSPAQLSQPASLQQTLQNAGLQLEQRLASAAQTGSEAQQLARTAATDLKAALLNTLQQLSSHLGTAAGTGNTTPSAGNQTAQGLLAQLQQLQQLVRQSSRMSHAANIDATRVLAQLQQLVQLSLNKLLFLQLQSISRRSQGDSAPGAAQSSWQLDIPVRYGNELQHIDLRIDEEWVYKQSQEAEKPAAKERQWLVKLSFELPDAGSLHAHLRVVNDSVSASLWAENNRTFGLLQDGLTPLKSRLEKDGCQVQQLQCFHGRPAEQPLQLSYSLVDIKT